MEIVDVKRPLPRFSKQEQKVFDHLLEGLPIGEISALLDINISTGSTYKTRIFKKMGVTNVVDLYKLVNQHPVSVATPAEHCSGLEFTLEDYYLLNKGLKLLLDNALDPQRSEMEKELLPGKARLLMAKLLMMKRSKD
jgi:DNA-binding CsgD family transcriptional regulator